MKVMFSGGGTAGHIYPALAMAEMIKRKYTDAEFVFVGRLGGDENEAVRRAGYPVHLLDTVGIRRSLSISNIKAIFKALRAEHEAGCLIKEHSPDIVIGTGGYVSWPVLRAGIKHKLPTLIHESNAYPGLVTRMLAKHVSAVMLGFDSARTHLPGGSNAVTVGNPVRDGFGSIKKREARKRLGIKDSETLILSFGGSLGSERMNSVILELISKGACGATVVHATGKRYFEAIKRTHPELVRDRGSRIMPYISDMPLWLSAADLAITRSGAITLAELCEAGIPSILIPSPNVSDDHQYKNALAMSEMGASLVIKESELGEERLRSEIERLLKDKTALIHMGKLAHKGTRALTEKRILEVIGNCL
ncbi:MAG: undecaprenyldiphospho-muramoylpentapeptide beta-N-acetylglucosaminyltransferase [Clostridia bacterium]|nr:undecaprenyldiphospho-muramoylpentapeptide beta-N-acetylglucosaminyltransferase [Clostridia bacterium]